MSSTHRTRPDADAADGCVDPPVPQREDHDVPDGLVGVTQDTAEGYSSDNEFDSTAVAAANNPEHGDADDGVPAMPPSVLNMDAAVSVQQQPELPQRVVTQLPERSRGIKPSVANQHWTNGNMMLVHLDLETGGNGVGIIQMASTIHDPYSNEVKGEFNEYVKPPDYIPAGAWSGIAIDIHGLQPSSDIIKTASPLVDVWHRWVDFVESHLTNDTIGCLVAWSLFYWIMLVVLLDYFFLLVVC
mmetsp:Transcript_3091/g.7013  ORF Transcript_3091/g.7013 Transcript_3091/m.7013 type:complete len:243 (+) Transcript_3091:208-936(+)